MKNIIAAAVAALAVGLMGAPAALADPTPLPVPGHGGYSPTPIPGYSCSDAWDFAKCTATGGKDMGEPPWYLQTHSASPAWTGTGR
ncbi:hypothetical protein E3G52_001015 [Mycobacteroides abscessus]|uniref:hypothetical protein n=1 Tax=Mycobacteroides abscessus TaxID=36809 RepID=UPI00187779D3|nr:hypothetical protein [Mycobacteroides abscessus]MBE5454142.1 hypothetical protein [Mycobacteroides abscessus]